jgi:hypothetical protein
MSIEASGCRPSHCGCGLRRGVGPCTVEGTIRLYLYHTSDIDPSNCVRVVITSFSFHQSFNETNDLAMLMKLTLLLDGPV